MSKPTRICFLADRHDLFDDRIYWKMAVPLVNKGFEVHYLLIDKNDDSGITIEGVHFKKFKLKIFSKKRSLNFLLKRFNPDNNYRSMFNAAKDLKADIYHFHDLWINRIGPKLKQLDHKPVVFYDAREPYAEDYLSYIHTQFPMLLNLFAKWVDHWEKKQAKNYDLVIANEISVQQNFEKVVGKDRSVVLYNYYDLELDEKMIPLHNRKYDLIYCGAITELRGAYEILKALTTIKEQLPKVKALFLGNYFPRSLKRELQQFIDTNNLTDHIELKDAVPYKEVSFYYKLSKIGLVLLQPVKTFKISMPIKIFEYMTFGLPIVGSNFGHIKDYIEKDNCGIVVGPNDTKAIAESIIRILTDEELYKQFSENGKLASINKYLWKSEFNKLLEYYNVALNER